jgi:hypothetical protein
VCAPIADAIRDLSTVNPHGSAVQAARALGIGFGDDADRADPFSRRLPAGADGCSGGIA